MKHPMLFPSFIRRLKRQMTKHEMKLRYGLRNVGWGVNAKDGVFRPNPDIGKCGCVIGVSICGQTAPGVYVSGVYVSAFESKEYVAMSQLTGWTWPQIFAVENGFERWGSKPTPPELAPYYELGQKIRNTMGKAA